MSGDLVWSLIRSNNSFMVKRDNSIFSTERGNLTNVHSYKFSGLANKATVHIGVGRKQKLQLTTTRTSTDYVRKPRFRKVKASLARHMRNHSCRAAQTIRAATQSVDYRPDMTNLALARYHALNKSLSVKPRAISKKSRKHHGRRRK